MYFKFLLTLAFIGKTLVAGLFNPSRTLINFAAPQLGRQIVGDNKAFGTFLNTIIPENSNLKKFVSVLPRYNSLVEIIVDKLIDFVNNKYFTDKQCNCPSVISKVCTIKKETYINKCTAECKGQKILQNNACLGNEKIIEDNEQQVILLESISQQRSQDVKTNESIGTQIEQANQTVYQSQNHIQGQTFMQPILQKNNTFMPDSSSVSQYIGSVHQFFQTSSCKQCSKIQSEVCASNFKTYKNRCEAECRGLTIRKYSAC